jgi:hypothetical protein
MIPAEVGEAACGKISDGWGSFKSNTGVAPCEARKKRMEWF